jgi:hypothetical protein
MTRRHAPIPQLTVELVPVYRCGSTGRRRLTQAGAYHDAAREAVREAHAEALADLGADWGPGGPAPVTCAYDDSEQYERVVKRLARWLRWRDGVIAARRGLG